MTLTDNISGRSYFYLPDNIQICKTKNNEMLPLETIALKDNADSKTFFVFPFNCSGHEIENMLSKHDFCWLHWDGFYEKDLKKNDNYILSSIQFNHPAVNDDEADTNTEDTFRNVNTYY